jgi:ATP-dependent protease HslVU (ClpYQ) peptidase subunit
VTTIVMDKQGLIAYDSRVTAGNHICTDSANKLIRSNGINYFICGREADEPLLIRAFENGAEEDYPDNVNVSAIIVQGSTVYTAGINNIEGYYCQTETIGDIVVAGSGGDYAAGALHAGCNAKEAVKIAIKCDNNSGGRVRTFQVPKG